MCTNSTSEAQIHPMAVLATDVTFLRLGHFTRRQLCLFLHRLNFQTSDLSNQHFSCCVSTYTFSSINTSWLFLHSGRHRNLKSIRSCSTVPSNSLIRTRYPLGFSKNVLLYSSPQLPTLLISLGSGTFHPILKESTISPLLKKSTLDNRPAVKLSADL